MRWSRAAGDLVAGETEDGRDGRFRTRNGVGAERGSEAPHFNRVAFRTPRKTFATLDAEACDLNLMFDSELRDFYCEQEPAALQPVAGGWGGMGATRCDLALMDAATLRSALLAAHRLAAPKDKRRG